jgi:hypothetical protein
MAWPGTVISLPRWCNVAPPVTGRVHTNDVGVGGARGSACEIAGMGLHGV